MPFCITFFPFLGPMRNDWFGLEAAIGFLRHLRCKKYKNGKKMYASTQFILWVQGIPISGGSLGSYLHP